MKNIIPTLISVQESHVTDVSQLSVVCCNGFVRALLYWFVYDGQNGKKRGGASLVQKKKNKNWRKLNLEPPDVKLGLQT